MWFAIWRAVFAVPIAVRFELTCGLAGLRVCNHPWHLMICVSSVHLPCVVIACLACIGTVRPSYKGIVRRACTCLTRVVSVRMQARCIFRFNFLGGRFFCRPGTCHCCGVWHLTLTVVFTIVKTGVVFILLPHPICMILASPEGDTELSSRRSPGDGSCHGGRGGGRGDGALERSSCFTRSLLWPEPASCRSLCCNAFPWQPATDEVLLIADAVLPLCDDASPSTFLPDAGRLKTPSLDSQVVCEFVGSFKACDCLKFLSVYFDLVLEPVASLGEWGVYLTHPLLGSVASLGGWGVCLTHPMLESVASLGGLGVRLTRPVLQSVSSVGGWGVSLTRPVL